MSTFTHDDIEIHYDDFASDHEGDGRPVVLIHGWPLSGSSWRGQVTALQEAGYRPITYDRRGFGRSGKPGENARYDYDALAGDLAALLDELSLSDVTLVGFSMGGGEVARYVGRFGEDRLHSVVFAAAIPPFLLKDPEENPDGGLDRETARSFQSGLRADRFGFLEQFTKDFFTANGSLQVDEQDLTDARVLAAQADLHAAVECIDSWLTDFRGDLDKITVPTLVVHGDADAIVPLEVSGQRTHERVDGSELVVIENGPHGINTSHPDEFNRALLDFLAS